jgi:tetratricopeptide (TPR) repeat protein
LCFCKQNWAPFIFFQLFGKRLLPSVDTEAKQEASMKNFFSTIFVLACLGTQLPTTNAQQKKPTEQELSQAKKLFQEGEQFFNAAEFQRAFEKYKEAYYLSDLPLFLLNMAICQYRLKNWQEAQHLYEAFLHQAPDSAQAPEAQAQLQNIKDELAKPNPALSLPSATPTPEKPSRTKYWLLGGIGTALLGGAAFTLVKLNQRPEFPDAQFGVQPAR